MQAVSRQFTGQEPQLGDCHLMPPEGLQTGSQDALAPCPPSTDTMVTGYELLCLWCAA